MVLLSDLNYSKLRAKQNKTALSGVGNVVLCPGHMVRKQGQTQASTLFRSSSNFNPLLEANPLKDIRDDSVRKPRRDQRKVTTELQI